MIIFKNRDATDNWTTWHKDLTAGYNLILDDTNAQGASGALQSPYVDSSFIYLGGTGDSPGDWVSTNTSGERFVFYAWTGIEGYSKFGSYTGNANADGPFIYTGFRPRLVITKHFSGTSTEQWQVVDTARNTENPCELRHFMNSTAAENTDGTNHRMDILSNGFKIRGAHVLSNGSTEGYIYMAFAEMPFKYANAR